MDVLLGLFSLTSNSKECPIMLGRNSLLSTRVTVTSKKTGSVFGVKCTSKPLGFSARNATVKTL